MDLKKKHTQIRVRYQETDQMGLAYYANYFVWFEVARTEYFRDIGIVYKDLEAEGYFLPVIESHSEYKKGATYDDLLDIYTWISEVRRSYVAFEYEIYNNSTLVNRAMTKHVFVNRLMKPVSIPQYVREKIIL